MKSSKLRLWILQDESKIEDYMEIYMLLKRAIDISKTNFLIIEIW